MQKQKTLVEKEMAAERKVAKAEECGHSIKAWIYKHLVKNYHDQLLKLQAKTMMRERINATLSLQ